MFNVLTGINIGQGAGQAFGGGIYAANLEIGFSNGPTKVTLNVVSADGNYKTVTPNVSSSPYKMNMNGKIFTDMYLYAYEKQKTQGSNLLTVSFVDSSILLDKIYIGLLHRQGNEHVETKPIVGTFSVRCPSCTQGIITGAQGAVTRYLDDVPGGQYFVKGSDGGGYIILGKENFPDTNCEIPKVDYNFSELVTALIAYGLKLDRNFPRFDLNPLYRQEYVGTLREVLNNWGADFSFQFFYENKTLKAIDLRQAIDISGPISFANTGVSVTSMSYGQTLENTYSQSVVARYLKPNQAVEYNNTFHYRQLGVPITLGEIIQNGACAGRSNDCLLTSVALARLDKSLRESYIANYAVNNNNTQVLQALGFVYNSSGNYPQRITDTHTISTLLQHLDLWQNDFAKGNVNTNTVLQTSKYAVFVGLYREDFKTAIEDWDAEAANFMGKYYRFVNTMPQNQFACPISANLYAWYTYNAQWDSVPASQIYGGDALPFASLLRDPIARTTFTTNLKYNIFQVDDNAWGIEINNYEADRGTTSYDSLKPQVVSFDDFPATQGIMLSAFTDPAPTGTLQTTYSFLNQQATGQAAVPAFLVVPLIGDKGIGPAISPIQGYTVNRFVYNRVNSRSNFSDQAEQCTTYCDANLVSELCNCGANYTPIPYFSNFLAPYLTIAHSNGNVSNVVFPCTANYQGYFTLHRYMKTTYAAVKKIYGTPPASSSNTMGIRVNDYDITPDLESIQDYNDNINTYIFSPTNQEILTAQDYYNSLANLNNIVIPAQQSIKFTVVNSDLSQLPLSLSPLDGLTNISMSLNDGGMQTELTYSTRPKVLPKPEAVFTKIKYRLKTQR